MRDPDARCAGGVDYLRVKMFQEQNAVGADDLAGLVERFGLRDGMERLSSLPGMNGGRTI
jgi:hypothetical protein